MLYALRNMLYQFELAGIPKVVNPSLKDFRREGLMEEGSIKDPDGSWPKGRRIRSIQTGCMIPTLCAHNYLPSHNVLGCVGTPPSGTTLPGCGVWLGE